MPGYIVSLCPRIMDQRTCGDCTEEKLTASVWFATKKLVAEKSLCKLVYSFGDGSPSNVRNHVIKRHSVGPEHKKIIQMELKQKEEKTKKRDARPKVPVYY